MSDTVLPTAEEIEQRFDGILEGFKTSIDDYKEHTKSWLFELAAGMEQVVEVNGHELARDDIDEGELETDYITCPKNGILTLSHHFEAQSFVPIPNTPYRITVILKDGIVWDTTKDCKGTLDAQGRATVNLKEKMGDDVLGKRLAVLFEPELSAADVRALYQSYDSQVQDLAAWLEEESVQRKQDWLDYLKEPHDAGDVLEDIFSEILMAFKDAWDDLKSIFHMLTHPKEMLDKLNKYLDNPELIAQIIEEGAQKAHDMLVLINDEVRVFVLLNAVVSWLSMLTPQQAIKALAGSLASVLIEVILRFIVPGGAALKALQKISESVA